MPVLVRVELSHCNKKTWRPYASTTCLWNSLKVDSPGQSFPSSAPCRTKSLLSPPLWPWPSPNGQRRLPARGKQRRRLRCRRTHTWIGTLHPSSQSCGKNVVTPLPLASGGMGSGDLLPRCDLRRQQSRAWLAPPSPRPVSTTMTESRQCSPQLCRLTSVHLRTSPSVSRTLVARGRSACLTGMSLCPSCVLRHTVPDCDPDGSCPLIPLAHAPLRCPAAFAAGRQ